jgi:2',3'-cyclic-nucleotide 2'-phosphodiesterase (5'-nucleotidase family)
VFRVNGVKVGVIGAGLETTPELVAAGNTAGLKFLPVADRIAAESRRLHDRGVDVQIVVIHEGTANGTNAIDGTPAVPWDGPIIGIAHALGDTTVDAIVAGHIHRVSNLMVGNILVTEGINAGASCLVLQLMVEDGDVIWAGGAMGDLVADAMLDIYPGVEAAITNSGGLRADIRSAPPSPANSRARSPGARCSRCCRSGTER